MARVKLTKSVVDAAVPAAKEFELRDTLVPGFLCKVTPVGRKVFMIQYRTNFGDRRKPSIGRFGELTVEQARAIARDWLADVRRGNDPSAAKLAARQALSISELCLQFIQDYSKPRNKQRTVQSNEQYIRNHIVPGIGKIKVPDLTRADVTALLKRMERTPATANHVLACLRKMFNMAEVWGYRRDGSNPCRHIPKYPENGKTRLITDEELARVFSYLDRADAQGLEHPTLTLAIRLQFEFAARMSEVCALEWTWVDLQIHRVAWPDSKTGGMSKPMSQEAHRLLSNAHRFGSSVFVCPSIFDPRDPLPQHTYYKAWKRVLKRANVPHVGTHGIRHRAATDIANSGIPVKVGMALTAHKTVAMFMRYVHTEDDSVKAAADVVANRRKATVERMQSRQLEQGKDCPPHEHEAGSPVVGKDGRYQSRTAVGAYRPFRHRSAENREMPPGSKRATTVRAHNDRSDR